MTNSNENQPVKLTITFADGHTRDFDTFISVVAEGLVPMGKDNDIVLYSAPAEGFRCEALTSISVDAAVLSGLLSALGNVGKRIIDSLDLEMLMVVRGLMVEANTKGTDLFHHTAIFSQKNKES